MYATCCGFTRCMYPGRSMPTFMSRCSAQAVWNSAITSSNGVALRVIEVPFASDSWMIVFNVAVTSSLPLPQHPSPQQLSRASLSP